MLVITVKDQMRFALSRDGIEIGTMHVSMRADGKARVAFDFPRDVEIWRGEIAADASAKRRATRTDANHA